MDAIISKALREFTTGPLNQLIVNLGGQDGDQWEEELKKFLRKEPCWSNGQVAVLATTDKFVAKDRFVVNTKRNAPVKISYLGDNFTAWFLSGDGKIEDPILFEMFSLMKKQRNGGFGALLNNGYANIFYIKDQNGVLRAVRVDWFVDGWGVDADSVENPHRWGDGSQVFSRNSVL